MSSQNPDVDHVWPASTAVEHGDPSTPDHGLKNRIGKEKETVVDDGEESISSEPHKPVYDHTHRKLKPRHVQLIGMPRNQPLNIDAALVVD